METKKELNFKEFDKSGCEKWKQAAEQTLKGKSFERLYAKTYEDIELQPIYNEKDIEDLDFSESLPAFYPYNRGTSNRYYRRGWDIHQKNQAKTPEEFNKNLKFDESRSQNAIVIDFNEYDTGPENFYNNITDLEKAFDGVSLDNKQIVINAQDTILPAVSLFLAYCRKSGIETKSLSGAFNFDPFAGFVQHGYIFYNLEHTMEEAAQLIKWTDEHAPQMKSFCISGAPYREGGGNAVRESAFSIAAGVEYMRAMQFRDVTIDQAAQNLRFTFSIGPNFFMELAKFRAVRMIWAKVVEAFGGSEESQKVEIHATTSAMNKSTLDPFTNMIRTTAEALAAAIGGVDSLTVDPFDQSFAKPNEFSRKIAINTHLILKNEAHLTDTIDPAAGSWYVEQLTDSIARKTWDLFTEVETAGGFMEALNNDFIQNKVFEVREPRRANLATRKDSLIGTNKYANLHDDLSQIPEPSKLEEKAFKHDINENLMPALEKILNLDDKVEAAIAAYESGASVSDITGFLRSEILKGYKITPIPQFRAAETFELLRKYAPDDKIFLANIGKLSEYKARSDFASDFFHIGGFETISSKGFEDIEEAKASFIGSDSEVMVICSSDEKYPDFVPDLARMVKDAQPGAKIYLAGYPKDHVDKFSEAGVDEFIHLRSDIYSTLKKLQDDLNK